jgi:hypothetical protein
MCNSNILHKRTPTFEQLHMSPYFHSIPLNPITHITPPFPSVLQF